MRLPCVNMALLLLLQACAIILLSGQVELAAAQANPFIPATANVPAITSNKCRSMRSKTVVAPFTREFREPPLLPVKATKCDEFNRCIDYYEIEAKKTESQLGRIGPKTSWFGYEGSVPGPTIMTCKGRQAIVKITNNITAGVKISTHLHGAATLAPWDGWAEDETEFGQAKYYRFPNNRAATIWYHDHDIHNTAFNAYHGLAGLYIVRDCCEDEQLESKLPSGQFEKVLIICDRSIDKNNQLFFLKPKEEDDLYGDIVLVNGEPWPVLKVQPRTYRFRLINMGISRTYTLSLDRASQNVPMWMVGTDGGLLERPFLTKVFTSEVGARYEIVIDFSGLAAGREVVLVNNPMGDYNQQDFCWTHLVMKFVVQGKATPTQTNIPINANMSLHIEGNRPLSKIIPRSKVDQAVARAKAGQFDKEFNFGRGNGRWVINGRTWDSPEGPIEAIVKTNDLELWRLENGGGGWVHPLHVHLVDFFVVHRDETGLLPYEPYAVKDDVLGRPGETVYALARYGPHHGKWMFHCHNLMHEDNDMMRAFEVAPVNVLASFVPDSITPANSIAADPMGNKAVPVAQLPPIDLGKELARGWYDVFYPKKQPYNGILNKTNIWEVKYNQKCVQSNILGPRAAGVTVPVFRAATSADAAGSSSSGVGAAGVSVQTMLIAGVVMAVVLVVVIVAAVHYYVRKGRQIPETDNAKHTELTTANKLDLEWDDGVASTVTTASGDDKTSTVSRV